MRSAYHICYLLNYLRKSSGKNGIGRNRVRKLLEAISCSKIRQILRRQIASGQAHYKENAIINELFDLIDVDVSEIGIDKEIILNEQAKKPISFNTKKIPDTSKTQFLFENERVDKHAVLNVWESTVSWKVLAFVLYFHGVSLSAIGNWFDVHKSTICRWLEYVSHWGNDWISDFKATFSGKVAIDEKWIKVAGE